jgi:glycolate oxidase iron-sulfur subunit
MRALERGEIPPTDGGLLQHLDACLGCRGCEPVCPAGVGYGRGLESARELLMRSRGLPALARLVLAVFEHRPAWRTLFTGARLLRDLGIAKALAGSGRLGFGMGMIACTAPAGRLDERRVGRRNRGTVVETAAEKPTVALFRGCVMDTLFEHVHEATRRTLEANGYRVVEVGGQACCGALHEHAGDRERAETLARINIDRFGEGRTSS